MFEFIFVLGSRYPTEKAYGVTIGRTVGALRDLGESAEIWAETKNSEDEFGNQIFQITAPLRDLRKKLNSRINIVRRISFITHLALLSGSIHKQLKVRNHSEPVLVIRELPLLIFLWIRKPRRSYILELHQSPNFNRALCVFFLTRLSNLRVCVISNYLFNQYREIAREGHIFIAEMAAPHEFFRDNSSYSNNSKICIGYIGKGTSSGHDNGLLDFLHLLQEVFSLQLDIELKFIGIESDYIEAMYEEIQKLKLPKNFFSILGHISHSEIAKELSTFTFGLLPYPENRYHDSRFPIKSLEYAASQVPILAAKSICNQELINNGMALGYDPKERKSLANLLTSITKSPSQVNDVTKRAKEWALLHTYESRAYSYVQSVGCDDLQ